MPLEDTLWNVLDTIGLGDTFDKYSIPPIVFPIAVLVVIGLLLFFVMPGGAPSGPICGDDICSAPNETCETCPADCGECPVELPPRETIVEVNLVGTPCDGMTVLLYGDNGELIGRKTGKASSYMFTGVTATQGYAVVESSSSKSRSSDIESFSSSKNIITITLTNNFCGDTTQYGSVSIRLEDSETGALLSAEVNLMTAEGNLKSSRQVVNTATFDNLPANKYYYFVVDEPGYQVYNSIGTKTFVEPGKTVDKLIQLISMGPIVEPTNFTQGELEVCVKDNDGVGIEETGVVTVFTADGEPYKTCGLDQCPLFRGQATSEGCVIFGIEAGKQVYAAVTHAPKGCSTSGNSEIILIEEGQKELVFLDVECNLVGNIEVIVYDDEGNIVTSETSVSLYDADNDSSPLPGVSGNELEVVGDSTESIPLPSGMEVYAVATPEGDLAELYTETRSGDEEVDANDTTTIEIELDLIPPPKPPLSIGDFSVSSTLVEAGEDIILTISDITLDGDPVTDSLTVKCGSSWDDIDIADYNDTIDCWTCNLTAPGENDLGEHTVSAVVTRSDAEPDSASANIRVVVLGEGAGITILAIPSDTLESPAKLDFFITNSTSIDYDDPFENDPVKSLASSNVTTILEDTGGVISKNLKLTKTATAGVYRASIPVPFSGEYTAYVEASSLVNNTLTSGMTERDFTVRRPSDTTLEGSLSTQLSDPSESFEVTATLTFQGNEIPGQDISAFIKGMNDESVATSLLWDDDEAAYIATLTAPAEECAYEVVFFVDQDPNVNDTEDNIIYVFAPGDPADCPIPDEDCQSLADAKACKGLGMNIGAGTLLTCAEDGIDLETCGIGGPGEDMQQDCVQPFAFEVQATAAVAYFDGSWAHYSHRDNDRMFPNLITNDGPYYYLKPTAFEESDIKGESVTDRKELLSCGSIAWASVPDVYHMWRTWIKLDEDDDYSLKIDGIGEIAVFLDGALVGTFVDTTARDCSGGFDDYRTFTLQMTEGWNRIDITMANYVIYQTTDNSGNTTTTNWASSPYLNQGLRLRDKISELGSISLFGGAKAMSSYEPGTGGDVSATSEREVYGVRATESPLTVQAQIPDFGEDDEATEAQYSDFVYELLNPEIAGFTGEGIWAGGTSFGAEVGTLLIDTETGLVTMNAYCPLVCGNPGDLNGDGEVDESDLDIMNPIMRTIAAVGWTGYEDLSCVDVNGDGFITQHDGICLTQIVNGQAASFDECEDCEKISDIEICGSGVDDDCDGQEGRDSYDESAGMPFGNVYGIDVCDCTPYTPCEATDELGRECMSLSGGDYEWLDPNIEDGGGKCTINRAGWTKQCEGRSFSCVPVSGLVYEWRELSTPTA